MADPPPRPVAISAHRGGTETAAQGTYEAFQAALETGAEYVEFDIRRTADAQFVVYHDATVNGTGPLAGIGYSLLCKLTGYEVPRVGEVMRMLAGKAAGHLDLKELGGEELIIGQALEILGPGNFVATTLEDASAATIKERFPGVPVALSLGRDLSEGPWLARLSARRHDLYPLDRVRACGADWAAINHRLAVLGVLRRCHSSGLKTMIWTVNADPAISRWLVDSRVDVVVTDRPRRAAELRERLRHRARAG